MEDLGVVQDNEVALRAGHGQVRGAAVQRMKGVRTERKASEEGVVKVVLAGYF